MSHILLLLFTMVTLLLAGYQIMDGMLQLFGRNYTSLSGRFGPWAWLLRNIGVNPRSRPVALWLVGHGVLLVLALAYYLLDLPLSIVLLGIVASASLWYFPLGTLMAAIVVTTVFLI